MCENGPSVVAVRKPSSPLKCFPHLALFKWIGNFPPPLSLRVREPLTRKTRVWRSSQGAGGACLARTGVGGAEGKGAKAARGTQDLSLGIWVIAGFLGGLLYTLDSY